MPPTVAELREIAADRGVALPSKATKAEIEALLTKAADAEVDTPAPDEVAENPYNWLVAPLRAPVADTCRCRHHAW